LHDIAAEQTCKSSLQKSEKSNSDNFWLAITSPQQQRQLLHSLPDPSDAMRVKPMARLLNAHAQFTHRSRSRTQARQHGENIVLRRGRRRYGHYVADTGRSHRDEDVSSAVAASSTDAALLRQQQQQQQSPSSTPDGRTDGRSFRRIHRIGLAGTGTAHNSVVRLQWVCRRLTD